MSENNPESIERVCAEVRRHIAAHSSGVDTAAGIVRWWLHADPSTAGTLAEIEQALERLEADGELERIAARDGRVAYRARSRR